MNVQSICEHANHIWKLLSCEHRKWTYDELKEKIGLPDREINAAIGWLACEGKLSIEETHSQKRDILYIELNYIIG